MLEFLAIPEMLRSIFSNRSPESKTGTEPAYESIRNPSSARSLPSPSTKINDPNTEDAPQDKFSHSGGGNYNLHPNPNPNYLDYRDKEACKNLF